MKTKKEAQEKAKEVVKILGKNWKPYVWENIGWHVHWVNGAIVLNYDSHDNSFWCLVGEVGSACGHMDLTPRKVRFFKNPKTAIRNVTKVTITFINKHWMPVINSVYKVKKETEK